ncbi:MAG: ATP-binding protein [Bacteroidales bacterium]|nr:ATP-binding protein [Bacteroidales bacterium]
MRLRALFVVMAVLQTAVCVTAVIGGLHVGTALFYALEGLTLLSLLSLIFFYRRLIRPLDSLARGLDMLRGQDRTTRLRHVGQPDVDNISDTFNELLDTLKAGRVQYEERTRFVDLLITAAPIGVVILDYDGRVTLTNPAARRLVPDDTLLRQIIDSLAVGATVDRLTDGGATLRCSCHTFIDCGVEHRFYLVEDITNSVAAAERAAYEKVIRIISHEVNNTVAGIGAAIDAALPALGDPDAAADVAEVLTSCAVRTDSLARFINRFAEVVRIPDPQRMPMGLRDFTARNAPFLQSLGVASGVRVVIEPAEINPEVNIDAPLLGQALVNIVKNAVESASCRGGAIVTVAIDRRDGHPVIEVTDNGPGIDPDKARRLFTPFYTDKVGGQGIGLTFVRDVVRRHGATCRLVTGTDGLTRFTIVF